MDNNKKVIRELEWYEKSSDPLVGNCILPEEVIPKLKKLLNLETEDLMVYVYPLYDLHLSYLQPYVEHKIDLSQYDYFIATYAVK